MTEALPPLDDRGHMPITNLRPLDFSTLLNYDSTLPAPFSPHNQWASIMSPLKSARRSPTLAYDSAMSSTLGMPCGSPYFGSFSPLFGTPRGLKAWGPAIPADVVVAESKPLDESSVETTLHGNDLDNPQHFPNVTTTVQQLPQEQQQQPHTMEVEKTTAAQAAPTHLAAAAAPAAVRQLVAVSAEPAVSRNTSMNDPVKKVSKSEENSKPEKKLSRKNSSTMSSIDKAAERRRKNRESSSRCYYNRKRIIETLDKQISEEKEKLTVLYDRALELRHENARLKKDVVTNGIALPTKGRGQACVTTGSAFQLRGYLQLLQNSTFLSKR